MDITSELKKNHNIMNREEWLMKAVDEIAPIFGRHEINLPPVRVSVGFPPKKALAKKGKALGVCFYPEATNDKIAQIFISPLVEEVTTDYGVLAILVHELIHALGCKGHRKDFKRVADLVGLLPPYPSTTPTEWLANDLKRIANKLGPFPHAAIIPGEGRTIKKDTCRMLKYACPFCDYTIRLTKSWASVGVPYCPSCDVQFEIQNKDKED